MSKLEINYITNANTQSGVGHQADEIAKRLQKMAELQLIRWDINGEVGMLRKDGQEVAAVRPWPGFMGSKSVNWIRLGRKIISAGPVAPAPPPGGAGAGAGGGPPSRHPHVWHLTNQTLSFLTKKLQPSIVTVHDLIELLEPQDKKASWLNRYLYSGITRASHIIAVSEFTKKSIQEYFDIPDEKISVIHNGVGSDFYPIENFTETVAYHNVRHELKLPEGARVVLYVGSDHPRKNVITAARAFAKARAGLKDNAAVVFLKVGAAGLPLGRAHLLDEIERLRVRENVRILENVHTARLNELYNLADVLIYPSRAEGFGLPPLQAMAAGTPVVVSNAASLPEVVGEAGLLHEPDDVDGFAQALTAILTDPVAAGQWRRKGLERARGFSWDTAAEKILKVYQKQFIV